MRVLILIPGDAAVLHSFIVLVSPAENSLFGKMHVCIMYGTYYVIWKHVCLFVNISDQNTSSLRLLQRERSLYRSMEVNTQH